MCQQSIYDCRNFIVNVQLCLGDDIVTSEASANIFRFPLYLKVHCIEFKYYADGIHSGLTPPG